MEWSEHWGGEVVRAGVASPLAEDENDERDAEDDDDDGGVERSVKTFARKVSYLSFAWRILLAIILWKDSLDFVVIVKNKSVDTDAMSLEQRVEQVIREHRGEGEPYSMDNDNFNHNPHQYWKQSFT